MKRCHSLQVIANLKLWNGQKDLRRDYCELLELAIIFLGDIPVQRIHFQAPGPISRAR